MKKEAKEVLETSPIPVRRHLLLPILTTAACFTITNHFMLSSFTPTSSNPHDDSLPSLFSYGCSRHSRHRSRTTEPSCFALSKHVGFSLGTPNSTKYYGSSLHCYNRSPSSAPSFCARSNHVRNSRFYKSIRRQLKLPPSSPYIRTIFF